MQVLNYTLMSKGAAVNGPVNYTENPDQVTFMVTDENMTNLHVYCCEGNDNWINSRDNGQALNADASMIQKLLNKNKRASA